MRRFAVLFILAAGLLALSGCRRKPDLPPSVDEPAFGHRHVFAGIPCSLSVTAADPDSDSVAVRFSWGDGDTSGWSAYVATGSRVAMAHTWQRGTYDVRAQARDPGASASSWFRTHHLTVRAPYPDTFMSTLRVTYQGEDAQLALSPDGQYLYVPDTWGLDVVRTVDNTWVTTVPMFNAYGVAASPNGDLVYVACLDDSVLRFIRTSDYTVVDSVVLSDIDEPWQVAVDPSGDRVYTTGFCLDSTGGDETCLYIVSMTPTRSVTRVLPPRYVYDMLLVPERQELWLGGGDDLIVMRTTDNAVVDSTQYGGDGLVLSADGRSLYRGGDGPVRVIDIARRELVDSLTFAARRGFAVLPGSDYLYIPATPYTLVYSISERTVVDTLPGVEDEGGRAIASQDGSRAFVAFWFGVTAYRCSQGSE